MDKKLFVRFVVLWFINSTLIFLASVLYPHIYVLGSAFAPLPVAVVVSGFFLTLLCKLGKKLTNKLNGKIKGRLGMLIYYWVINSVALWLVARFAPFTGFGITAFYWAFALGFATNLGQWLVRQLFKVTKLV